MVLPMIGPAFVTQALPPVHQMTLDRARMMTNPTCSLSIAAILCGVLVMAIRGGLQRNEAVAGGSADV
jgi:hypothetical protein